MAELTSPGLLVFAIVAAAGFTQATAGFGLALLSMPLLVTLLGVRTAAPLIAIVGLTSEVVMLARYRTDLDFGAVARLSAASLGAIPIGVFLLLRVDPRIITTVLGVILVAYPLYALLGPTLPRLAHRGWAYGFGFASGLLSGAFNTGGPPVVIYGSCRRWGPGEFKGNLQGFFLLNSLATATAHALSANLTPAVLEAYVAGLPGLALGLIAGFALDSRIGPDLFRRIVLLALVALGLRLLWG